MLEQINLGLIPYTKALEFQIEMLEKVYHQKSNETLIICSHRHVLTVGRFAQLEDIQKWDGDIVKVQRGGGVTFHGPGQIIIYPILDLRKRHRDTHKVLRNLEKAIIDMLKEYHIESYCKAGATGVWIRQQQIEKKIASIGIGVRKWISYHGLAFNFKNEFLDYGHFSPCGFSQETMIGLIDIMPGVSFEDVQQKLISYVQHSLCAFMQNSN